LCELSQALGALLPTQTEDCLDCRFRAEHIGPRYVLPGLARFFSHANLDPIDAGQITLGDMAKKIGHLWPSRGWRQALVNNC